MKKICILLMCVYYNTHAQPNLNWVFSNVGSLNGFVEQNFKCSNGDILMLGYNNGADIDPGPGINTSSIEFFARYNQTGNLVFGHPFFIQGGGASQIGWITNDADDNFYLTFMGPGVFDLDTTPGIGEITLTLNSQAFVKYDGMGNYKWNFICPDPAYIFCSAVLSDKSIIVAGMAGDQPVDIDPGLGVYIFNPQNTFESFLAKFDSSGNFITAREFHTSSGLYPNQCILQQVKSDNDDNIYLTGYFEGTVDFDPGLGTHNLITPNGAQKIFMLKMDNNLNFVYAHEYDINFEIQIDKNNNVFMVGGATDSTDIDPTSNVCLIHPAGNYIAKLFPSNAGIQWVKTISSSQGTGITFNGFENDGSMYCTFTTHDTLVQNSFGLPNIYSVSYPWNTTYMAKLDSNGYAIYYFDLNSGFNLQNPRILFSDPAHFYYSGRIWGPTDVEIGPGIYNMAPAVNNQNEFFLSFYSLEVQMNRISGNAFIDLNGNAIADTNENGVQNAIIEITSGNSQYISTDNQGDYSTYVSAGSYSISVPTFPGSLSGPVPLANSASFSFSNQIDTANNFAFGIVANEIDVSTNITGFGNVNPGFDMDYNITYTNNGSTVQSGVVEVKLDSVLTLVSSSVLPDNINGNTLQWNFSSLNPFQSSNIDLAVTVNNNVQIGDSLLSTTSILPITGDVFPLNNYDTSMVIVTGSFDPNFKEVNPSGNITPTEIISGTYLTYTIHFQNTGNDTALNVIILDTLSGLFDIPSFNLLASSHACQFTLYPGNLAEFKFKNILLPDSNINEPASSGFIKYRIKPLSTLIAGDQIKNNATIYLDFNEPIQTNVVITNITIPAEINLPAVQNSEISISPNPASETITVKLSNELLTTGKCQLLMYDIYGREVYPLGQSLGGVNQLSITIDVSKFAQGMYFIELKTSKGSAGGKVVIAHNN